MQRISNCSMGRERGLVDRVFCLIYCKDIVDEANKDKYSLVLAQMRSDGKMGFPGGKVEQHHNNLIDALLDELKEEIGLIDVDLNKLKHSATFANENRQITTYKYEVSYDEFKQIYLNSKNAMHFFEENMGCVMLKIHESSIKNIYKQFFCGTGKSELKILINDEGLL